MKPPPTHSELMKLTKVREQLGAGAAPSLMTPPRCSTCQGLLTPTATSVGVAYRCTNSSCPDAQD